MDVARFFLPLIILGFPVVCVGIIVCTWVSWLNPSLGWLDIFRPLRRAYMRRLQEDWDWARQDVRRRRGHGPENEADDRGELPPGVWFPSRAHRRPHK